MLKIEKYKDEIKAELEKDKTLGCVVNKLMGNTCDDYPRCNDCYLKVLDWLLQEYKEPILTEEDKKILKDIINVFNSFKKEIVYIRKRHICRGCYLYINYIDRGEDVSCIETHSTFPFNGDKLFKGMELNKSYTLEELGLC